jgi:DNA-binding transcriptional MocR family regulator
MEKIPPGEHLSPFETQRKIHELFAQETRHRILQTVLGHPAHLPSLAELAYYSQKSESAVLDQLDELIEYDLVATYTLQEGRGSRDLPGTFYGPTERGVLMFGKFGYLQGVPMLRAVHDATAKTERIRRHESAPRPYLPPPVAHVLARAARTAGDADHSDPARAFTAVVGDEADNSRELLE